MVTHTSCCLPTPKYYLSTMIRFSLLALGLLVSCTESKVHYNLLQIDNSVAIDSIANSFISPYRDSLDETMRQVLVVSTAPIPRGKPDSPLGNLITDLVLQEAKHEIPKGKFTPEFCLLNIGGLRIDLPKADINLNRVFELMPFENRISLVLLTPKGIKDMINYLVGVGGQPTSGLQLLVQDSAAVSILINGKPLEQRSYWVVTSDYLADGGDKMDFFADNKGRIDLDLKIRDAIIRNFKAKGEKGVALEAPADQRIIISP